MKFLTVFIMISGIALSSLAQSKSEKAQVLDFKGMDIKNSKGSPRDAFSSAKEKADFEYFFKTKVSFKKKVIESLEVVR